MGKSRALLYGRDEGEVGEEVEGGYVGVVRKKQKSGGVAEGEGQEEVGSSSMDSSRMVCPMEGISEEKKEGEEAGEGEG